MEEIRRFNKGLQGWVSPRYEAIVDEATSGLDWMKSGCVIGNIHCESRVKRRLCWPKQEAAKSARKLFENGPTTRPYREKKGDLAVMCRSRVRMADRIEMAGEVSRYPVRIV